MIRSHFDTIGGIGNQLHRALSEQELRRFAPSIYAEGKHNRTSDRYTFLPTASILSGMEQEGWVPVAAQQQVVRQDDRAGFQKHMIRFAHLDDLQKRSEERPEVVLVNSHDRSSAYQLHAGLFRLVCCNGLVFCDETLARVSLRHQGFKPSQVIEATFEIVKEIPAIQDQITQMKSLTLSQGERQAFAEAAAILRFEDLAKAPVHPNRLLEARRAEDNNPDLWRTFNTVQENTVKGGQRDYSKRKANGERMPRTRAVKGIDGNTNLNKALHHLATEFMKMKQA